MSQLNQWLAPPRRLLFAFVLLLLVPAIAVVWLGARLIQLDRNLETRQVRERLDAAVDRAVGTLDLALSATERRLSAGPETVPVLAGDDAVVITQRGGEVEAFPPKHLLYYPTRVPALGQTFVELAGAERLEFQKQNHQEAADAFRAIAASSPRDNVKAAALLGLARNLKRLDRSDEALRAYDELVRIPAVEVNGLPADLVGRRARVALLAESGNTAQLQAEGRALRDDLIAPRWRLDRGTFVPYIDQVNKLLPDAAPIPEDRLALAEAAAWFFDERAAGRASAETGRRALRFSSTDVVALWQSSGDRLTLLIAGPRVADREWLSRLKAESQRFDVSTVGDAATGLPWTITLTSPNDPQTTGEFASRRRLLIAGLALLLVLVIVGGALTLRAVSRELAAAQLQSDFVSAVSHEFRTPLTSLRQFTDLLGGADEPPAPKRQAFYQAQARATDRLQRLVESLLDFGRMEAGARPYHLESLSATDLARQVVLEFRRDAAPASFTIEFSSSADTDKDEVAADRDALARALWNLLDNAVKYSGQNRNVSVKVSNTPDGVAIAVRDAGIGIARHERDRIFEKFVRGAAGRDAGIDGTGVGLAMVRHIISAHRGTIEVESEPGVGSTFTIRLPATMTTQKFEVQSSKFEVRS